MLAPNEPPEKMEPVGTPRLEQFTVLRSLISTVEEGVLDIFVSDAEQRLLGRLNDLAPSCRAESADQLFDLREHVLDRIQVG